MKQKSNLHITTIWGNVGSGKTTLAKDLFGKRNYVYVDMNTILQDYSLDQYINPKVLLNGKPEILASKMQYADPRISNLILEEIEDDRYFICTETFDGNVLPFNKTSRKYQMLLNLIMLIRSRNNLLIDNLDVANVGRTNSHIYKLIVKEIENSKSNVTLTFTDISLWQLFSLSISKDTHKKFFMTKFSEDGYDNIELDYLKLAFTINSMYDSAVKKAVKEDRKVRYSDIHLD